MSREAGRLCDYLRHVAEAIERIARYTDGMDGTTFRNDSLVQDAVIRNIEVIGEASRNILVHHPDFGAEHPDLPLASAYQMRNALAHGYFQVDLDIVWQTLEVDLPALLAPVHAAVAELERRET